MYVCARLPTAAYRGVGSQKVVKKRLRNHLGEKGVREQRSASFVGDRF